jgi:hypothetical protein
MDLNQGWVGALFHLLQAAAVGGVMAAGAPGANVNQHESQAE